MLLCVHCWCKHNTGYHNRCTGKVAWLCKIRPSRLHIFWSGPFSLLPPPYHEQPAASGQQPPNCWGVGVLPYLIALDDVIDLPQVVRATCFVADLQQHQAYFLLSQFSHSDSILPSLLKYTGFKKGQRCVCVWVDRTWEKEKILRVTIKLIH